jgi:radical SAM protein with 4Fe4S-binding SPASM domain
MASVSLLLTESCNLSCKGCYNPPESGPIIDIKNLSSFIASYQPSIIKLLGGEPTLHPQLFELFSFLNSTSIPYTLITNGLKFKNAEFLKNFNSAIGDKANTIISLWGNQQDHQQSTGKNSYDFLLSLAKEIPNLDYSLVVGDYNTSNYQEAIKDILSLNKRIVINGYVPPLDKSSLIDKLQMQATFKTLAESYLKNKKVLFNTSKVTLCDYDETLLEELKNQGQLLTGCSLTMGGGFAIDTQGRYLPCSHFNGLESFSVYESADDIAKSQAKQIEQFKRYPQDECKTCSLYRKYCWGGCPIWRT